MSTITGNTVQITGLPGRVKVRFALSTVMLQDGSITLMGSHIARTDEDGDFVMEELRAGPYKVFFNDVEYFSIIVPDDDASYAIEQLIPEGGITLPTNPEPTEVANASDTQFGLVRTLTSDPAPVVPRVADLPEVNVLWSGAKGDGATDDTAALQGALDAAAGGALVIPEGTFLSDTLTVPSNIRIRGTGVLKFKANTSVFALLRLAGVSDVHISGITLDGNAGNQSVWSEHRHLATVLDASNITFEDVTFKDPIGDGLYIGNTATEAPFAGCENIKVSKCSFLGSLINRNGVSVITGRHIKILDSYFYRMGRPDMPGAVCLEPNDSEQWLDDILVRGNTIVGGASATLQQGVAVQNTAAQCPMRDIAIVQNNISGQFRYGVAVFGGALGLLNGLTVEKNTIRGLSVNAGAGIVVSSAEGDVLGNIVTDVRDIGIRVLAARVIVRNNTIRNAYIYGLQIQTGGASGTAFSVTHNHIFDAGVGETNPARGGLYLDVSNAVVTDNTIVSSNTAFSRQGIYMVAGSRNVFEGNQFFGIGSKCFNITGGPNIWGRNYLDGAIASFESPDTTFPPSSGTWAKGVVIWNPFPGAGDPIGWRCVVTGTPGTWEAIYGRYDSGGNLVTLLAGAGLKIKEGANARMGLATLAGTTTVVSNTTVTSSTRIFLFPQTNTAIPGHLSISTRSPGVSFTIRSSESSDDRIVAYLLVEPS